MTRSRGWIALGVVATGVVASVLVALDGHSLADIPAGTGYAALDLCSRTMVTGEPEAQVLTHYIAPKMQALTPFWRIESVPGQRVTVSTRIPWLEHSRTAVYRPGLGCTLLPPGSAEAELRAQAFRPAAVPLVDSRPWPLGEGEAEVDRLGAAARAAIERHASRLFSEQHDDETRRRNTTALLVAHQGHLVYERYGQGHRRAQPQIGWSMTKSLTAIVAGLLARDGKLALDEPVGFASWQGTPKQKITWRHLLNMAPGLAWFEGYGGESDATEMLFSQPDQGAWAASRPITSEPGTVFSYSTGTSNIAMKRMQQLLGGSHQAIYDYYQEQLFAPLGIRDGVIEPDAVGTPVGGARGLLRPVDWLRLAQLVANGGTWNGEEILPSSWVTFMRTASPASSKYAGSMWLDSDRGWDPALRARLPKDVAYFAGHMGQFAIVVPSQQWVVLRMGVQPGGDGDFDDLIDEVLALVADLSRG